VYSADDAALALSIVAIVHHIDSDQHRYDCRDSFAN
jgi:hypothetical protein